MYLAFIGRKVVVERASWYGEMSLVPPCEMTWERPKEEVEGVEWEEDEEMLWRGSDAVKYVSVCHSPSELQPGVGHFMLKL